MSKRTLQDKYLLALLAQGEREVKRLTGCIVVTCGDHQFYYLGAAGSLRKGSTRAASIPCGEKFKQLLLSYEADIKLDQ